MSQTSFDLELGRMMQFGAVLMARGIYANMVKLWRVSILLARKFVLRVSKFTVVAASAFCRFSKSIKLSSKL